MSDEKKKKEKYESPSFRDLNEDELFDNSGGVVPGFLVALCVYTVAGGVTLVAVGAYYSVIYNKSS